jgi:hypothetical protein
MRDSQAKAMFINNIGFLEKTSPREFRIRLLCEYESSFNITHSAACSLYNKIKKQAVAEGLIPEIGRPRFASVPNQSCKITKNSHEKHSTDFNEFLISLELRIEEENSWAVYDHIGNIVCYADSGVSAKAMAGDNHIKRVIELCQ